MIRDSKLDQMPPNVSRQEVMLSIKYLYQYPSNFLFEVGIDLSELAFNQRFICCCQLVQLYHGIPFQP